MVTALRLPGAVKSAELRAAQRRIAESDTEVKILRKAVAAAEHLAHGTGNASSRRVSASARDTGASSRVRWWRRSRAAATCRAM